MSDLGVCPSDRSASPVLLAKYSCQSASCPAVFYKGGDLVVVGKIAGSADVHDGLQRVVVPASVVSEALKKLDAGWDSTALGTAAQQLQTVPSPLGVEFVGSPVPFAEWEQYSVGPGERAIRLTGSAVPTPVALISSAEAYSLDLLNQVPMG